MSVKGRSRSSLPTISNPQLSYSQRYQHMTKLANYNEMNESQIWKEYQKLRACLKELNEEVLYHMQKKAYSNLNKNQKAKPTLDQQGTLVLLEDQKKSNDLRLDNFNMQFNRLAQRIKLLASKPNLLDEYNRQSLQLSARIKQVRKDNRDLSRNAQLQGRDLVNNTSILDKIMIEEQKLARVFKQHKKYEETIKIVNQKIQKFKQKIVQLQKAIDLRVQQFARQENYIAEEIHFQRYEQLKKQKDAVQKYEPIYKRNYLMKLKDLQSLVGSIARHDKVIQQTESNILNMRNEIEVISALVGAQRRRHHSSISTAKKAQKDATQLSMYPPQSEPIPIILTNPVIANDKNQEAKRT